MVDPEKKASKPRTAMYINNRRAAVSLGGGKKLQPGETVRLDAKTAKVYKGIFDRV